MFMGQGRRVGYARVSTLEQSLSMQETALKAAGCELIFKDHGVSGAKSDRAGLADALGILGAGDTLVVYRLDRLARSLIDLVDIVTKLHARGVAFQSLNEHIDISSAYGEFVLHILGAVAHFERALIQERTRSGVRAAQARGVRVGRKAALDDQALKEAVRLLHQGEKPEVIARKLGCGRSTLYRYLAEVKSAA